ncbi:cytochrome c oxidase assembly factor Coa1 family protein [Hyalangium gracile]|uniref:cytochrome c oxidase assembly factor Coa1 family protein n=1 Tax=Hyalangium gracile TaxID=394092 RepID=UPI001CCF6EA4|nr:cytochrome c oxidase assembly factor Coa1 family protein [Hyalangium gracile]
MTPEGNMAPQPSWWSRNWKWAVPVGCLGIVASCMCFGAIAVFTGFTAAKKNPAAVNAVAIATSDSEVQATLGTPIQEGSDWQTSVQYINGQSSARFGIPLQGSKAAGLLHVEATKSAEDWTYQVLQVEVPGQPPIDLMDKVGGGTRRELAPPTPDAPPPTPEDGPKDEEGKPDLNL